MPLDVPTLTFAGALAGLLSGIFLLMYRWQDRTARAAGWAAASYFCNGIGVSLIALQSVVPSSLQVLGPWTADLGAALSWIFAAVFNRGCAVSYRPFVGICAWIAVQGFLIAHNHHGPHDGRALTAFVGAGGSGCLYLAAALEFWAPRRDRLAGRWPMILLLVLNATALFCIAAQYCVPGFDSWAVQLNWFGGILFVGLIYAVGSAISLVIMLKGRSEAEHKAASLTDPLTGLANRRAFTDQARRAFARNMTDAAPVSLLAFDLDSFKAINDTFGHAVGDQILRIFADCLRRALRPADLAARMGGEEFAVILPGCGAEAALAIAGRIRIGFQDDARFVNGSSVGATVSVGIATETDPGGSFVETLERADAALYRAKALGRNRVSCWPIGSEDAGHVTLVRIA